jgi:hypothetical protein
VQVISKKNLESELCFEIYNGIPLSIELRKVVSMDAENKLWSIHGSFHINFS